jgi:broad specificity phosphatase PhoE
MVIHLIRHLKPSGSGVEEGRLESPLEVASVFSSPLRRALLSAELFFPRHEIQRLPELAEISLGEWEGLAWEEIESRWPMLASEKLLSWFTVTPPGGESWSAFEARVDIAWSRIRAAPSPVAVVAHAGVNFVLAKLATGRELTRPQNYGEVITLDIR